MIVLDTTVLVYAVGAAHPLREPCRAIVKGILTGSLEARTTVEVIQEFVHVRARRRDRQEAAILAHEFAGALQPLIVVDELDLKRGLDIFTAEPGLGAFDCVLAGAAMRRGARALVSADTAFAGVDGLNALSPEMSLAEILGDRS